LIYRARVRRGRGQRLISFSNGSVCAKVADLLDGIILFSINDQPFQKIKKSEVNLPRKLARIMDSL